MWHQPDRRLEPSRATSHDLLHCRSHNRKTNTLIVLLKFCSSSNDGHTTSSISEKHSLAASNCKLRFSRQPSWSIPFLQEVRSRIRIGFFGLRVIRLDHISRTLRVTRKRPFEHPCCLSGGFENQPSASGARQLCRRSVVLISFQRNSIFSRNLDDLHTCIPNSLAQFTAAS
jgi:hypothetical protein